LLLFDFVLELKNIPIDMTTNSKINCGEYNGILKIIALNKPETTTSLKFDHAMIF